MALTAANEHDSIQFEGLIGSLPRLKQRFGYRRKPPDKVHADKGYDFEPFLSASHCTTPNLN